MVSPVKTVCVFFFIKMPYNRRVRIVISGRVRELTTPFQAVCYDTVLPGAQANMTALKNSVKRREHLIASLRCFICGKFMDAAYKLDGHIYCKPCIEPIWRENPSRYQETHHSLVYGTLSKIFKAHEADVKSLRKSNHGRYRKGQTSYYDMCLCKRCNSFMINVYTIGVCAYCRNCANFLYAVDNTLKVKYNKSWTQFTSMVPKRRAITIRYPDVYLH